MKRSGLWPCLLVFLLGRPFLRAEELKVGYIDSGKILEKYMGTGDLVKQFDKEVADWRETATTLRSEIDALYSELSSQQLMLSEEAKAKKREEIARKEQEYQSFVQEIWGAEGKAVKRRDELTKPVVEKIDKILERLGSEEGYAMIFDISEGSVVYAKEKLDLTDLVLEELNREFLPLAQKGEKAKFIVFDLQETTREASELKLGKRVSALMKTMLPMTGKLEAVEDWKVQDQLRKEGAEKAEEVDLEVAYRVGEKVQAEVVFLGTVSKLGEEISAEVKMGEATSKREIATDIADCTGEGAIEDMVRGLVERLVNTWRP